MLVDLRDYREILKEGKIPGAFSCPRGMLEFWIDPDSPYHKEYFNQDKTYIFYCASAWRSALAAKAAMEMGLSPVVHLEGGFNEKTNGLIRQFFPKQTQFNPISDQKAQSVMEKINIRWRKYLGMKTSNQILFKDYSFVALRC